MALVNGVSKMARKEGNKMCTNHKIYLASFLSICAFAVQAGFSEAKAQSVNIKRGQLQQAGWYKSNLQVQIVDDGPIVNDMRRAPAQDRGFEIPIGAPTGGNRIPEGGIPLGSGPAAVRMAPNTLPTAGFGSNITARGIMAPNNLQQAKMGGLGDKYAQQQKSASTNTSARPLLGKPTAAARAVPAAGPASYSNSYGGGGAAVGTGGGSSSSVRGKLLGK